MPTGNGTLEEAGADSTLALSDDGGEMWKCRRETKEARFENGILRSTWFPWPDVEVETWLVPTQEDVAPMWHLRVHRVRTGRKLWSAEGGFAVYGQGHDGRALEPSTGEAFGTFEEGEAVRATSRSGVSGIFALEKQSRRTGKVIRMDANSNLLEARTVLPTLVSQLEPSDGDVWFVTGVFAIPNVKGVEGPPEGWMSEWEKRPEVPEAIATLLP